jgi:hypothetical protein
MFLKYLRKHTCYENTIKISLPHINQRINYSTQAETTAWFSHSVYKRFLCLSGWVGWLGVMTALFPSFYSFPYTLPCPVFVLRKKKKLSAVRYNYGSVLQSDIENLLKNFAMTYFIILLFLR